MPASQSESTKLVLEELSQVSDSAQFLKGVQRNPDLVLDAIKGLVNKNSQLLQATSELELTQSKLRKLEKKASISSIQNQNQVEETLSKLTEALSNLQPTPTVTLDNHDVITFNGDKQMFSVWKSAILMKIKSNPRYFPSEKSKMNYIYSKMSGNCQAHLHSWISEGELLFPSLEAMFQLLGTLFDDPNRVRDAKARLFANHQRNKPFSSWIAEIRRDAAIAGYDKYLDPLRDLIFLNLSLELKQAIVYERDLDKLDLDSAIARLQDIDNKQRSLATSVAKSRFRGNLNSVGFNSGIQSQNSPLTTTQGGDAMDISSACVRPRGPLSQEEKNRRRNLGLCIYCGGSGHVIRNCPLKPPQAPLAVRSTLVEAITEETSGKA